MMVLLKSLRDERVKIYEDCRMSGVCGMCHVVVNRGN
jgi:ferredoxin